MFYLDDLYKDNVDYPIDGSKVDKFLFYRRSNDDIDVDVCEANIKVYKRTNPFISNEAVIKKQTEYNKSGKKYEIIDGEKVFRGETLINCMQILLQIVNYDDRHTQILSNDFNEILNGLNKSSILVDNPKLVELLNLFIEECYSEGNFFAIPFIRGFSLNQAKGKLKQKGYNYYLVDSADIYFQVCYDYFNDGKVECQIIKYIENYYEGWKNRYSNKWKLFIEDNLFQDFVDDEYVPIKLWDMNSGDFSKDLEQYLVRAIDFLSKRRKRIAI